MTSGGLWSAWYSSLARPTWLLNEARAAVNGHGTAPIPA